MIGRLQVPIPVFMSALIIGAFINNMAVILLDSNAKCLLIIMAYAA